LAQDRADRAIFYETFARFSHITQEATLRNAWVAMTPQHKGARPQWQEKPDPPIPTETLGPEKLKMGVNSNTFPLTLAGVSGKLTLVFAQVLAGKQFLSLAGCHEAVVNINSIPV
jgi:hypothetical protein